MGDVGEFWRDVKTDWKERSRAKRWGNLENAVRSLEGMKVPYEKKSQVHFVIDDKIDYWPTTGKFIVRSNQKKGRGLMNLVNTYKTLKALEAL